MAIFLVIPWVITLLITGILACFKVIDHIGFTNLGKLLDPTITFTSILLGFLSTSLGILITIRNSQIMKKLYENNYRATIKYYFYEAITSGFLIVILSLILKVADGKQAMKWGYYIWIFVGLLFSFSSYRLITTLLGIMFRSDLDEDGDGEKSSNFPQTNTEDDNREKLPVDEEKKSNKPKHQSAFEYEKGN